jgi:CRISPR-associated protein Cmr1
MEFTIKTLTPIWTGGVETGQMDRLHETGIIGSLRWWYEAIVRGLGGWACDPSQGSCIYDEKKPNNGLCDVCQVFGATGWRRRFRLVVQDDQMREQPVTHPIKAGRSYQDNRGNTRTPTWYFQNPPQAGQFSIQIQSLQPEFSVETIQGLIQFVTDWAALGARPQMGFGVVEITSERLDSNPFNTLELTGNGSDERLPSLQNMFFARIQHPNATDQNTFNLKYDLRLLFANDTGVRHFVMGTVKGDRIGSKIFMSRPYANGLMRVWGWVSKQADIWNSNWDRESVLTQIRNHLRTNYQLVTWREFNSLRDTNQQHTDMQKFLHSLWEGEE